MGTWKTGGTSALLRMLDPSNILVFLDTSRQDAWPHPHSSPVSANSIPCSLVWQLLLRKKVYQLRDYSERIVHENVQLIVTDIHVTDDKFLQTWLCIWYSVFKRHTSIHFLKTQLVQACQRMLLLKCYWLWRRPGGENTTRFVLTLRTELTNDTNSHYTRNHRCCGLEGLGVWRRDKVWGSWGEDQSI